MLEKVQNKRSYWPVLFFRCVLEYFYHQRVSLFVVIAKL